MIVSATHDARQAATAASAALPPSVRISAPASAVAGCPAAMPAPTTALPSANAFGEAAAKTAEALEWKVEPLAHAITFRDLERALADRSGRELAVVELHRQAVDRKLDLGPAVAVRERPGEPVAYLVRQLDGRGHPATRLEEPLEEDVFDLPERLRSVTRVRQPYEHRVAVG